MATMGLESILLRLLMLLTIMPIHEYAHAAMADRLGDTTARMNGRLTLNPLQHLDLTGTIAFLLVGIGWGRPVPVYSRKLRRPRRDMALVALAGPVSNILMSLVLIIVYRIALPLLSEANLLSRLPSTMLWLVFNLAATSAYWAVFNLLPIPPLDGSRLLEYFLPPHLYFKLIKHQQVIYIGMLVLLVTGLLSVPLSYVSNLIMQGLSFITTPVSMLMNALLS